MEIKDRVKLEEKLFFKLFRLFRNTKDEIENITLGDFEYLIDEIIKIFKEC